MAIQVAAAASRFGFGARPGDMAEIGRDPRGWLVAQIHQQPQLPASLAGLRPSAEITAEVIEAAKDAQNFAKLARERLRLVYLDEAARRTRAAIETDQPVIERLVQFWGNHFTVSVRGKPAVLGTAAAFEREAIRPHVLGRFGDMLAASTRHPAMLVYLDNIRSVGPNSRAGQRGSGEGPDGRPRKRDINENLAREILELHTLGVKGGYSQDDVIAFAKVLTGWTVARRQDPDPGSFHFFPQVHEPGAKTFLGRSYPEGQKDEGDRVLADLARHPATADFIATKLARHFIADDPPRRAVEALAKRFRETDGDLRAVTLTLVDLPETWAQPFNKVKTPTDLVVSAYRGLGGYDGEPARLVQILSVLDQAPFGAPSPAGWPDTAADWISAESTMKRVEWARAVAGRLPDPRGASDRVSALLASTFSNDTRFAIDHAASAADGLAFLLASPEFQRR